MPRPEIELSVRADAMISGTERARQGFEKLKQTASGTFTDINSRAAMGASALNTNVQSVEKLNVSYKTLGLSLLGIGTSTVGVITSLSNLDRAAARVEKAHIAVARIEDQIASTRARLNQLTARGRQGTEQYAVASSRLSTALDDLKVKQEDIKLSQDALNDSQVLYATMLINTAINSGFLISQTGILSGVMASLTITTKTGTGAMIEFGNASLFSAAGVKALTLASLAFMRTPLGLALTALAAAMAAFETDLFGLRTGIEKTLGFEKDSLSMFNSLGKMFEKQSGVTKDLTIETGKLSNTFTPVLSGGVDSATESFGGFSTMIGGSVGGTGGGVIGQINELNLSLTTLQEHILKFNEFGTSTQVVQNPSGPILDQLIKPLLQVGTPSIFTQNPSGPLPTIIPGLSELTPEQEQAKRVLEWMQQGADIQEKRAQIQKQFNLLGEVELNRAKVLRIVLQDIGTDVAFKVTQQGLSVELAKKELELRKKIALEVFNEAAAHRKVAEEQKKSLLPLSALLELLKGTSANNPLFGFNGVFSRDAGGGSTFGQTTADRYIGFHGGIGSTITVDGKTFHSRQLNPLFGRIEGGGVIDAIEKFRVASGGGSSADGISAISRGLVRAVSSFINKRTLRLPFGPDGEMTDIETTGFEFRGTGSILGDRAGNYANPNFALGRPSGGGRATPMSITIEQNLRDTLARKSISVFGLGGAGQWFAFANTLVPEARDLLTGWVQLLVDRMNSNSKWFARSGKQQLASAIDRAMDLDRRIRMGYIEAHGRGQTLQSLATEFNISQSKLFDTIRTKFDVIDLEARKFFQDRESLQMIV